MASFTVSQYLQAKIPDLTTLIPGANVEMLSTGAMAVYWDQFFDADDYINGELPEIEDSVLTERQKVLCALRAAVTLVPIIIHPLTPVAG
jgi:hypothetical protein